MVRLVPQLYALGPLSQRRLLSLLDTVVTGTTTFCPQLIMLRLRAHNLKRQKSQRVRQTEFNLLSSMPASLMGVVVGNYKMSVEDPDEVKWSSCIRDGGWSFDFTPGMYQCGKVHLHENYNSFNIQNDICTLVLQTKVNNIEFIVKHLQTNDKLRVIENMV